VNGAMLTMEKGQTMDGSTKHNKKNISKKEDKISAMIVRRVEKDVTLGFKKGLSGYRALALHV
jgi:hypothetical protein